MIKQIKPGDRVGFRTATGRFDVAEVVQVSEAIGLRLRNAVRVWVSWDEVLPPF